MIHIGGKTFELIRDHKNGFNLEAFRDRYNEVLDRYDYIVGDWGYSQLRLKGFFKEGSQKANKDTSIAGLHDYLNEYCNFGCAYFIVEKVSSKDRDSQHERFPVQEFGDVSALEVDQEELPQSGKKQPFKHHAERRKHPVR